MNIFVDLFEAFIKCSTKCWLRASGEPTSGNAYAEWVKAQNKFYRDDAAKRLMADVPANECEVAPVTENLKSASGVWPWTCKSVAFRNASVDACWFWRHPVAREFLCRFLSSGER